MRPCCRVLLIAVGLAFHSPLLFAAQSEPAELAATPASVTESAPLTESAASEADAAPPLPDAAPVPVNALPQTPAAMDLTKAPTSLWQRIRNGFGLPDMASPLVREQEEWFVNRPDYIKRIIARSSRYLYHIVAEIEKRGMPTEIALLPIIESAFNPTAYSRAHASGIWQFIPSTGRLYGLQQNFWYDGRRDVMAATNAALDYLQKLYETFGSWDLALASYNWGEGAVGRAIAKNQAKGLPANYQSLSMPNETHYYMPKLQAVKNIVAHPAQYGVELAEVPNQPYFVAVTTTRHIDVRLAARLAEVPFDEFVSLNPGHSGPVIRTDDARTLLLPADKADTFLSNLENHNQPLVSWQAYTLKSGDKIERIAARHGIALAQLKQVNGFNLTHRVVSGSTLLVPAAGSAAPHLPDLPAQPVTVAKAPVKSAKYAQVSRKGGTTKVAETKTMKVTHTQTVKAAHTRKAVTRQSVVFPAKKTAGAAKTIVLAQGSR